MTFKLNISSKGKAYKLETENSVFVGKKIGEKIDGKEIDSKLEGFELKITGASNKEGFPLIKGVSGVGLKKVLLTKGKGMRQKKPHGLKLRKSVNSEVIDENTSQINLSVIKQGARPFEEVFGKSKNKQEGKKMPEEEQKENEQEKEEEKKEETNEETEETENTEEEKTEESEETPQETEESAEEESAEEAPEENTEEEKTEE